MLGIREWVASRRYGGQTGLNEMGNNAKMTALVTAPFLVGWLIVQLFVPFEYVSMATMLVAGFWMGWCVFIWAYAKADASSYRAFPQPVYRFPDGGVRVFNKVLVPPDSWELVHEFEDGSKGYHIHHDTELLQYQQKGHPFPFVWDSEYWKVPAKWDETFAFASGGEFFHKGIAVDHGACESVSVYVVGWHRNRDGKIEPVCLINDCNHRYEEMMENSKKISIGEISKAERFKMMWRRGRKKEMDLLEHESLLEDTVEVLREKSKDVKKLVDQGMGATRDSVHTIMDTGEPLYKRVFSFKNVMKGLLILAVILIIGHFFFGFP